MVLQIRFAIWLTLQIEVQALHICKPSHHFASTISTFHIGLRLPGPLPRAISLRSSALPAAPARPDGGGRSRTDANDDGDERGLGWTATGAKTWAGRPGLGGGAKEKKYASAIGEKILRVGSILWVYQV